MNQIFANQVILWEAGTKIPCLKMSSVTHSCCGYFSEVWIPWQLRQLSLTVWNSVPEFTKEWLIPFAGMLLFPSWPQFPCAIFKRKNKTVTGSWLLLLQISMITIWVGKTQLLKFMEVVVSVQYIWIRMFFIKRIYQGHTGIMKLPTFLPAPLICRYQKLIMFICRMWKASPADFRPPPPRYCSC